MNQSALPLTNTPEISVSDLAGSIKRTLETSFGRVRVRGELSRVTIASSGHMYSTLKDEGAAIDAVCWKGTLAKMAIRPEEGLEVICTGRVSSYPARSNYQLIIDSMELAGQGALLKMLEERRKKLAAEGLFDQARKRPLPFLPERIGVVTSPTGAVIRDILHRLADRFPRHVMVWPVLVQGSGAAQQVADAIKGFNALPAAMRPDLLIVARGGGSLEDLMPFNEEIVVRAAAESKIPLISAVGHETDTTLIDYAADRRAPTPTAAAEMAVPVRTDLIVQVMNNATRLTGGLGRIVSERRHILAARSAALGDPSRALENRTQRLDRAGLHLGQSLKNIVAARNVKMAGLGGKMRHPREKVEKCRISLNHLQQMLTAFSFENVLQRGFALVQDEFGHVVRSHKSVKSGQKLEIRFAGGAKTPVRVE